ncbi:hypothetical protein FGO68_gene9114 [Halteria grandinella]|uniref:Uncharacterized protein n=1 Tax=Halteria grandinella TaxID=5974 RepID=A0A8J8T087_HALGN|nr:hypothetical protein FGO68_gene9114 [Halteria grandinella]
MRTFSTLMPSDAAETLSMYICLNSTIVTRLEMLIVQSPLTPRTFNALYIFSAGLALALSFQSWQLTLQFMGSFMQLIGTLQQTPFSSITSVNEFYGIYSPAATISASAVSGDSSHAFLRSYHICACPCVLVSQNSFLHLSSSCFVIGVSYAGVFLMPSPLACPESTFSTFGFCKQVIRPIYGPAEPPPFAACPFDTWEALWGCLWRLSRAGAWLLGRGCCAWPFGWLTARDLASCQLMQQPILFLILLLINQPITN